MNIVWENLKFFMGCLRDLPVSGSLSLGEEGFCVSTGTEAENWVYFPESVTSPVIAEAAVKFFRERGEASLWPLYGSGGEVLESCGVVYDEDLSAMALTPVVRESGSGVRVERVRTREEAALWAETAGLGFGDDGTAEGYRKFAEALSEQGRVSLYLAKHEGQCAGTFLVTYGSAAMGVYYFAVVPELRRKGFARAMMDEVCRLSGGKRVVLQATPIGEKFYRSYGFEELFRIRLYRL